MNVISLSLIIIGLMIVFIGSIGLFKFRDFLTRTHAASVIDTLGVMLIIFGLMFDEGFNILSLKLFILFLLVFISCSTTSYLLAQAYYKNHKKSGGAS
tara:strand:+ start:345 stop:638 length:294 start_codon:yes stop_codon:yes gene_type:complete